MHRLHAAVALATAMGAAVPATAGPLTVAPTTVQIAPDRHSAVVTVVNDGDAPVVLQFRAYDWAQRDGRDALTPSAALAVSPAIATVAPHARQLFRVTEQDGALVQERSYRLRLNEIPAAGATGVGVALEFSLPVFHTPAAAAPRLRWEPTAAGVRVTNDGDRRVRFAALALTGVDGAAGTVAGATGAYLLAGASRDFPAAGVPAGARLAGVADTGPIDVARLRLAAR